ncbi:hypothetical protein ACSZOH_14610 [Aeromonas caviae]
MNEIKIISEENFTLEISENVHKIWNSFRQIDHKDLEACGVLIGAINHKEKIIFIDLCSTLSLKIEDLDIVFPYEIVIINN